MEEALIEMKHNESIVILLSYSDLYDDNPEEVIKSIFRYYPTALWRVSSYINTLLFSEKLTEKHQQLEILKYNLRTKDCDCVSRIELKIKEFEANGNEWILFNRSSMLSVFKILMENMNNKSPIDDTPKEFDEVFLKLVLIANQRRSNFDKVKLSFLNHNDTQFQQLKFIWPIRFAQIDNESKIHIVYQSIRCLILLNFVREKTPDIFKMFQEKYGFIGEYDYFGRIIDVLMGCYVMGGEKECSFFFSAEDENIKFYDSLSINKQDKQTYDISDIKFYPLFKHQKKYYVTDWCYFGNQFYQGLWSQLRQYDGTNKSDLGHFFEKNLMEKLFRYIFKNSDSMIFDEENSIGIADCYIRIGRKILLFELKDSLFPEKAVESFDFDAIKRRIDNSMISSGSGRKKAIRQLCDNIEYIYDGHYKKYDWEKYNLKGTSLEIYPIILYTDDKFRVEGVNYYLNERFRDIVSENIDKWKSNYKAYRYQIKDLTVVGLEFLLNNMISLHHKPNTLFDMITKFHLLTKKIPNNSPSFSKYKPFEKHFVNMDFIVPEDKDRMLNVLREYKLI